MTRMLRITTDLFKEDILKNYHLCRYVAYALYVFKKYGIRTTLILWNNTDYLKNKELSVKIRFICVISVLLLLPVTQLSKPNIVHLKPSRVHASGVCFFSGEVLSSLFPMRGRTASRCRGSACARCG
jgi:hypothetical protein